MEDLISRQAALDAIMGQPPEPHYPSWYAAQIEKLPAVQPLVIHCTDCTDCEDWLERQSILGVTISELPSAQPQTEWNNHTVACLLAELFGDACACNYNGIDEWLPEKCEVIDACPNPVGVACWEQFLTHRAERRTDDKTNKGSSC